MVFKPHEWTDILGTPCDSCGQQSGPHYEGCWLRSSRELGDFFARTNGSVVRRAVGGFQFISNGFEPTQDPDPTHPSHYADLGIEPLQVIDAWNLGFNLGSVIKYIGRHGRKPGAPAIEDLKKAAKYLEHEIKKLTPTKEQANGEAAAGDRRNGASEEPRGRSGS